MTLPLARFEQALRDAIRPPRRLSLAAWADEHFVLPPSDPNAGRWRSLPYQRGLLDALTDPAIERVIVMKSARVGYTKCYLAAVAHYLAHDPCPILVVQPTLDDANKHAKEDVMPMLEAMPALRALAGDGKPGGLTNTILDKRFATGGHLTLIGANSPRGFRRTSRRVVVFDEIDGYPTSAGAEGDQIILGVRRAEYFHNRKILMGSTPTLEGYSRIEEHFLAGDQRRYYVPCPHCGTYQVLKFPNLTWTPEPPERAWFRCEGNGCRIEARDKRAMLDAGEWRAEAPEHFTPHHRWASFHIWAAYSYAPHTTWGAIAQEYTEALQGGDVKLRTFANTVEGRTWRQRGEAPPWEPLLLRREPYRIGTVPRGGLFVTAGVDVQRDRLLVELVAWGRGKENWSVDYLALLGDPVEEGARGPWRQLDALLDRPLSHEGGTPVTIRMLAIDSGYLTQQVYNWARRYPMSRVIAIKGHDEGGTTLIAAPSPIEVSGRGARMKRGYKVWPVQSNLAKNELYAWLRLAPPADRADPYPPGYCHFPEYAEAYFKELTAEQLVPHQTRRGYVKTVWQLIPGRQNHALDCRVYARAAAQLVGLDRFREQDWRALEQAIGQASPPPPPDDAPQSPPDPMPPRGGRPGWLPKRSGWLRR